MGHFLTAYTGSIIFFNTTKDVNRYGKTDFFMMPSSLTEKQKCCLNDLVLTLRDFSRIIISYDTVYEDGFIEDKSMSTSSEIGLETLMERFYDKLDSNKKGNSK